MHGIATRSGFLCAEPLLKYLNVYSVTRISLSFYNTKKEIKYIFHVLEKLTWILNK
jgi:cysteine desulfurase/selenocysteine lyase